MSISSGLVEQLAGPVPTGVVDLVPLVQGRCNHAMMTKLIFNLGGESGGGGGGAKVAEGGMSPWRGYFQCFFP